MLSINVVHLSPLPFKEGIELNFTKITPYAKCNIREVVN
jgi:hypothetical protein